MGRQLVARLRLRARLAIKKFFVKETMQRTAMTRNEVNHGINLQKLLKNGRSVEGAAAEEGINVKDAEEILAALAIKTARLKRVF
jgi:hypothetical protein